MPTHDAPRQKIQRHRHRPADYDGGPWNRPMQNNTHVRCLRISNRTDPTAATERDTPMTAKWYCTDCETRIEPDEIDKHESDGHHVKGALRPDRLIGNDPWHMHIENDGETESHPSVRSGDGDE